MPEINVTIPVFCEQYRAILKLSEKQSVSTVLKGMPGLVFLNKSPCLQFLLWTQKIFCVNLCLCGIIRCICPWKDKHGQGQRKIFFRIALKQAEELGLIYECISTIHLKICNVCAAWQEKKVRVM